MWVEAQFHVGNDSVSLKIERLEADACERTAAVLAWLTLEATRSGAESECRPWREFVNDLLGQHVAFTVPDERLADPDTNWWSEVVGRALTQFVRENDLAVCINRHLQMLQNAAATRGFQS